MLKIIISIILSVFLLHITACSNPENNNLSTSQKNTELQFFYNNIYDAKNDLLWQRCAFGMKFDGKKCIGKPIDVTWLEAKRIVHKLNTPPKNRDLLYEENLPQWRIPTLKELETLYYCPNNKHNIDDFLKCDDAISTYKDKLALDPLFFDENQPMDYFSNEINNLEPPGDGFFMRYSYDFSYLGSGGSPIEHRAFTSALRLVRGKVNKEAEEIFASEDEIKKYETRKRLALKEISQNRQ